MARPREKKNPKTYFTIQLEKVLAGFNLSEFERKKDFAQGTMSQYLRGVRIPGAAMLKRLAESVGKDVAYFTEPENSEKEVANNTPSRYHNDQRLDDVNESLSPYDDSLTHAGDPLYADVENMNNAQKHLLLSKLETILKDVSLIGMNLHEYEASTDCIDHASETVQKLKELIRVLKREQVDGERENG